MQINAFPQIKAGSQLEARSLVMADDVIDWIKSWCLLFNVHARYISITLINLTI